MSGERILGIDLGTTNSAVAVFEGGEPSVLPNESGERTTPSVVSYDDQRGTFRIGQPAKNRAIKAPESTVESVKRHVGDREFTVSLGGRERTPEEISGLLLQRLKRDAEAHAGTDFDRAVITVPAYFDDRQRQATKDAGEIAGFEVERIVNEPTAAAMAYGLDDEPDTEYVLVFDLGGGTFDVSLLELTPDVYEVLATDGHTDLGGDDWDRAIIDWAAEGFQRTHGIDLREDREALQRLKTEAEAAKVELSTAPDADLQLPFVTATEAGPLHLERTLDRATFEGLTEHLLERVVAPTERVIESAPITRADVDEVLLVGGATRMPMVRERVAEITGIEPQTTVNPDEAVALGAAVQGGVIGGAVDDLVLLDVTPLSLGVEVQGGLFEPIIDANTTIPTVEGKPFTTAEDDQTRVTIRVFQGERAVAEENEFLGEFTLSDIPPAPAGAPNIDVQFRIDENGIVDVAAEDAASGAASGVTLDGSIGLPDDRVEQLRAEARAHAEEDERRRARVRARNDAKRARKRAETLLSEYDSVPADLREQTDAALSALDDVLDDESAIVSDYEDATADLRECLRAFGTDEAADSGESALVDDGGETDGRGVAAHAGGGASPTGTEQAGGDASPTGTEQAESERPRDDEPGEPRTGVQSAERDSRASSPYRQDTPERNGTGRGDTADRDDEERAGGEEDGDDTVDGADLFPGG